MPARSSGRARSPVAGACGRRRTRAGTAGSWLAKPGPQRAAPGLPSTARSPPRRTPRSGRRQAGGRNRCTRAPTGWRRADFSDRCRAPRATRHLSHRRVGRWRHLLECLVVRAGDIRRPIRRRRSGQTGPGGARRRRRAKSAAAKSASSAGSKRDKRRPCPAKSRFGKVTLIWTCGRTSTKVVCGPRAPGSRIIYGSPCRADAGTTRPASTSVPFRVSAGRPAILESKS